MSFDIAIVWAIIFLPLSESINSLKNALSILITSNQVRTVDTAFYTSWVKGKINFKDQRLEDIMRTLSRWYNIEVDYSDEALKNLRFGCYVNRYEEIAPFLELLEATENIHVKINGKTIIFYK